MCAFYFHVCVHYFFEKTKTLFFLVSKVVETLKGHITICDIVITHYFIRLYSLMKRHLCEDTSDYLVISERTYLIEGA